MTKIIIVDSSYEASEMFSEYLVRNGYDVIKFASPVSLYINMEVLTPGLILINHSLRDESGFDVCKRLRRIDKVKNIPILMYGDNENPYITTRAIESGADDYILRTLNISTIHSKIKSLIRINTLRDELTVKYAEIEEKNQILENQLKMGKMVQRALLQEHDFELNGISFVSKYLPAIEIGGDFFEIIRVNDDMLSVVIGDVSGHGISAALLTAMMSMMLRKLVPQYITPPQVLYHMNNEFCGMFENCELPLYVCLCYALIDTKKKMLYFANAGQPMPFYVSAETGIASEFELNGTPIGLIRDSSYEFRNFRFSEGDVLLLYTDGLSDNLYKTRPELFYERIVSMLRDMSESKTPPRVMINSLENTFAKYREQELSEIAKYSLDDVSMVLCQF